MESQLGDHSQMNSGYIGNSEEKIDLKYGLRENPRKTWRAEDLETPNLTDEPKLWICKQCGKGFKSMKALCGHMACHSEKDRFFKDDYWTSNFSETEESGRKKPKKVDAKSTKVCGDQKNDYSSVSEISFQQEEVAMCLIMLSRDYRNWDGVGLNQESSDSVVLETKSSSIDVKPEQKRDRKCVYESVKKKKLGKEKWESGDFDSENEESSDECFETNGFRKRKSVNGSRVEVYDALLGKNIKKDKELANGSNSKTMKSVSKNKNQQKAKALKSKKKARAHECPYCNRVFDSGQALGGHKRTHTLGNNGNRSNRITNVFEVETSEVRDVLDLNLPAHEEDEESQHSQFINW